jgi:hypothetical protein
MNIKVSDLKKFQRLSSHIKPNGILPASNCIKFGDGKMVKNAHSAFVSYDCPSSTESVLVDEHGLNSVLSNTASEFVNIAMKGKKLVVSDSRDNIPFPTFEEKEYNPPPNPEEEIKPISPEFLEALGRCAETCQPRKDPSNLYMFVHVGKKMIAAGNGFMGVCFPIEEDYTMVIERGVAALISKHEFTEMSESQGHYFFYGDGITMGFSKQEIGFAEMGKMMNGGTERTFTISASDVLSFNSLALSLCKDWSIVTMHTGRFEMTDSRSEYAPTRPAEQLKLPEPFNYNADNMNQVIKALGVEELDFYHSERAYFIKSTDTKATAIIAKISK